MFLILDIVLYRNIDFSVDIFMIIFFLMEVAMSANIVIANLVYLSAFGFNCFYLKRLKTLNALSFVLLLIVYVIIYRILVLPYMFL